MFLYTSEGRPKSAMSDYVLLLEAEDDTQIFYDRIQGRIKGLLSFFYTFLPVFKVYVFCPNCYPMKNIHMIKVQRYPACLQCCGSGSGRIWNFLVQFGSGVSARYLIWIRTRELDLTFLTRNLYNCRNFSFKMIQCVFDYIHHTW
jgi:hypothetical protein